MLENMDQFRDMLANMSEEEQAEWKANFFRDYGMEFDAMSEQAASAEALRDTEGPSGMEAGGMYVAASPLSHLASGVEKYRAKKDLKGIRGKQDDLIKTKGENFKSLGNSMIGMAKKLRKEPTMEMPSWDAEEDDEEERKRLERIRLMGEGYA